MICVASFVALPILLPASPFARQAPQSVLRVGEPVEARIEDGAREVHTPTLDVDTSAAPTVGRTYRIVPSESGLHHMELRSWHFDAYLVLRDAEGADIALGVALAGAAGEIRLCTPIAIEQRVACLVGGRVRLDRTIWHEQPLW